MGEILLLRQFVVFFVTPVFACVPRLNCTTARLVSGVTYAISCA